MASVEVLPRHASSPMLCPEDGCTGRIVLERPQVGLPLVPMCTVCHTVLAAARPRVQAQSALLR